MALLHAKTAEGRQEIEDRARRLPAALRSLLLMVDGQRDDDALRALLAGLRAPGDALEQLQQMGLIEVVGGQAAVSAPFRLTAGREQDPLLYQQLREAMCEAVSRHLGLKGYLLQRKIERCGDAAALERLWPEMVTALGKACSPALAERWLAELRRRVADAVPA